MKIGILGTRGIPNRHGGFEQFAEIVSKLWNENGHEIYVYCGHNHEFQQSEFEGIKRILVFDPEYLIGTSGQFFYDLGCIMDARKRNFDILLQLGYTSNSIWGSLLPRHSKIITNMDGLEWKRSKYSAKVQLFLKYAEKWAIKTSDFLISDSIGIQSYLEAKYKISSTYIPYGAEIPEISEGEMVLEKYGIKPFDFNILIARMEPENNIEMILEGIRTSGTSRKTLVIGSTKNTFGTKMEKEFASEKIIFPGANYNKTELDVLRNQCYIYYHGHSVGGTNPSLLEAMASGALISAHKNEFNESILGQNGLYFSDSKEIIQQQISIPESNREGLIKNLQQEIQEKYSWNIIAQAYLDVFEKALGK
jgi:glycosyltransferase involved in cell wall biosynthesis